MTSVPTRRWRPSETTAEGGGRGGLGGPRVKREGGRGGRKLGERGEAEQEGKAPESDNARGRISANGGRRAAPTVRGCALGTGSGDGRARGGSASRRPPSSGRLPPRYIGEGGVLERGVPGVAKPHRAPMPPARGAHK